MENIPTQNNLQTIPMSYRNRRLNRCRRNRRLRKRDKRRVQKKHKANFCRLPTLPQDIIDYILSFGDVYVAQKFDSVLRQFRYNRTEFDFFANKPRLSLGQINNYSGFSVDMFYLYILDKSYIKKNVFRTKGKTSTNELYYNHFFTPPTHFFTPPTILHMFTQNHNPNN